MSRLDIYIEIYKYIYIYIKCSFGRIENLLLFVGNLNSFTLVRFVDLRDLFVGEVDF